ncbi:MAG TPA: M2 family metallopeptidase [Bacilli bacterium]|nr:M2 family metallopeptidase [Bacilli bacterium]
MNEQMQNFLTRYAPRLAELSKGEGVTFWNMTTTGLEEDEAKFTAAKAELLKLYADRDAFAELKRLQASGAVTDPLLARQLDVLYNRFAGQQIDPAAIDELVKRETEIESAFTNFRAVIDGTKVSENDLNDILAQEKDNAKRRQAWEASKQIGTEVAGKVIALVKLRNEAARQLGYENFYKMSLALQEIEEQELFQVLAELKEATDAPFASVKAELDGELAARFGIDPQQVQAWHYADPFFQEAPAGGEIDLDRFFKEQDVVALSKTYFDGIGLEIQDILDRSDLFEREGKNQHAYCIDIDREGDVRILCNCRSNEYWMSTMLHELGHAVYDKYHDTDLPWTLREPAHTLTTEAIAMLFGRLTKNADWLHKIAGVDPSEAKKSATAVAKQLTRQMLIFMRWGLVMTHFERDLYANPEQDLNALWWQYVEQFQRVTRPEGRNEPDWAAKIHLGCSPVYYQNYILGELTASQLNAAMERDLGITSLTGAPQVGTWLTENVFRPGNRWHWNEMIANATGEPLSASYFVEQFVK